MTKDKLKQWVAMLGGALGGVLLFLRSLEIEFKHFNELTIESFTTMLVLFIPLILVGYGIYKNQYIITKKAKVQEEALKEEGLK